MSPDNPKRLCFSIFSNHDFLIHGIFNRHGGVSPAPYNSLNISFGVNDDSKRVQQNRAIIQNSLNAKTLISASQVHGTKILVLDKNSNHALDILKFSKRDLLYSHIPCEHVHGYDAFVSNIWGVALMVQQADCQAVMLVDPCRKVVANIHCGWRGSVKNIIDKTVVKMQKKFGVNPKNILAGISPSLGPCCAEFTHFKTELPPAFWKYQVKPNYFDFWKISMDQLQQAGIKVENIEISSVCTACNKDWFSYRSEKETGRFCSIIGLT